MQIRSLPQSIEAEMAILGGIFVDNEAIHRVIELIRPEDLYRESHRKILAAMIELSNKKAPCDLPSMVEALKQRKELEEVGGAPYLATLIDYVPTSANIAHYCKIVNDKAFCRQVISSSQEIAEAAYEGQEEIGSRVESLLMGLTRKGTSFPIEASQLTFDGLRRLEKRWENKGKIQGIPYGIPSLDKATSGMNRGDLIVIAGRPSMGKSALAGNILENVCKLGCYGMLFSLEMDAGMNIDRMMSSVGNVRYENVRSGNIWDAEWGKLTTALNKIAGYKLLIDDSPAISLREIRAKCYRQKKKGLDVVVTDYLQLMEMEEKETRSQAIGKVSRGLKRLAREMDCVAIAISQLNRAVDSRPDKRPTMSDLRDSGEIEQDADVILFPFRPAAYCQQCRDRVDNESHNLLKHQLAAEIIIEKQRNGERNISVPLVWLGKYQRFEEIEAI